ncbi:aa3-type cytochrome c oxidase subunit IV [uncultured Paracoccus sp.]|uniref:aa3-type cytochrome c oxidase subunit IV n=1 Tax=uncultured Paracoccus sp. TaxID=189685 RepID=UPI002633DFAB|nr:aa3-type cytochrome c oxidase subunit IV [uncultured Paracoccus sp.]
MATHHEVTEHKHGEMDITQHQKTFAGFVKLSTWVVIISLGVLVFMALTNA